MLFFPTHRFLILSVFCPSNSEYDNHVQKEAQEVSQGVLNVSCVRWRQVGECQLLRYEMLP